MIEGITINGAKVIDKELSAVNGVIHTIDRILWP